MKIIHVSKFRKIPYTMVISTELVTPIKHSIFKVFQKFKVE